MKKGKNLNDGTVVVEDTGFADSIYNTFLEDRKIIINDVIDSNLIERVVLQILKFNAEDKGVPVEEREPITLLISSPGGEVISGLGVIDAIKNSKTPINAIVLTCAYSMAFLIFIACHKRYMMPSASLLLHDGSTAMTGSANKVKDLQQFYDKLDSKLKDVIIKNSKITAKEYERNKDRELYLFPEEAIKKGLCDGIIYKDIDIDDIF